MQFKPGIPTIEQYKKLLKTNLFVKMESFSNQFLHRNQSFLANYSHKWVPDPFHTWSRQWEYPFVFDAILKYKKKSGNIKILDAGSGATFFPYFIAANINRAEITCCDNDLSLKKVFTNIKSAYKKKIDFITADISSLPYKNNTFDIIYCISVLEHTKNFETIIKEFKRILKHQGRLVVTFDISITGGADIPPKAAEKFSQILSKNFPVKRGSKPKALLKRYQSPDIVTTNYIKGVDKKLLPWKHPLFSVLKSMLKFRFQKNIIKNLTFFCYTFEKF